MKVLHHALRPLPTSAHVLGEVASAAVPLLRRQACAPRHRRLILTLLRAANAAVAAAHGGHVPEAREAA